MGIVFIYTHYISTVSKNISKLYMHVIEWTVNSLQTSHIQPYFHCMLQHVIFYPLNLLYISFHFLTMKGPFYVQFSTACSKSFRKVTFGNNEFEVHYQYRELHKILIYKTCAVNLLDSVLYDAHFYHANVLFIFVYTAFSFTAATPVR